MATVRAETLNIDASDLNSGKVFTLSRFVYRIVHIVTNVAKINSAPVLCTLVQVDVCIYSSSAIVLMPA